MSRLKLWPLTLALLMGTGAWSQTPTHDDPLAAVLPDAQQVRQAVLDSPAARGAAARLQSRLERAQITETGNAEFTARLSQQRRRTGNPDERWRESTVSLERPLRGWGKASLDAELAGLERENARIAQADALHETSRELLDLWFDALRARTDLDHAQTQLRLAQALQRQAGVRLREGDISPLDASLADAESQRAEATWAQTQAQHRATLTRLQQRYPGLPAPVWERPQHWTEPTLMPMAQLRQQVLEHHHELRLWRGEAQRLQVLARRLERERWPDPTVGVYSARERGGNEQIHGVSISMPLPGQVRQHQARAAQAEAQEAHDKVQQIERELGADIEARHARLQTLAHAATRLQQAAQTQQAAADKSLRAYSLGEHSMTELIQNRRLASEQGQASARLQLEVLELLARIQLDLHALWDFD